MGSPVGAELSLRSEPVSGFSTCHWFLVFTSLCSSSSSSVILCVLRGSSNGDVRLTPSAAKDIETSGAPVPDKLESDALMREWRRGAALGGHRSRNTDLGCD